MANPLYRFPAAQIIRSCLANGRLAKGHSYLVEKGFIPAIATDLAQSVLVAEAVQLRVALTLADLKISLGPTRVELESIKQISRIVLGCAAPIEKK